MRGKPIIFMTMVVLLLVGLDGSVVAQVPSCVNYQGRIIRNGTNFTGVAQLKFKLLNAEGATAYWSNDGTGGGSVEPALATPVAVVRGLFYVRLGDTNLANMVALSPAVFTNVDLRLRIWVDSGAGSELITPDQVMASVGYAMMSASVGDGIVTPAKLSPESRALFVPAAGGTMTGPLTNSSGYFGVGGLLSNVVLVAVSNGLSVGTDQLVAVSNRVGIGTASPDSRLDVRFHSPRCILPTLILPGLRQRRTGR
jgi:hypothetical protein